MARSTKQKDAVLRYLREHPDETNVSRIARETGTTRPTARAYLEEHRAGMVASGNVASGNPPVGGVEGGKPEPKGRDFTADFPPAKPVATKPVAKVEPVKTAAEVPEPPEPEAEADEEDWWGLL